MLSLLLTMPLYLLAHRAIAWLGIEKLSCVCIAPGQFVPGGNLAFEGVSPNSALAVSMPGAGMSVGAMPDCVAKYSGRVLGITAQSVVDGLHYLSAVALSFARGLNDTPKIAGLLLSLKALDIKISMLTIAAAMALGGLMHAHRVAETMSKKISKMNDGQALIANLVTSTLVIGASRLGMPVSTTHVSVGAIAGIGLVNRTADRSVLSAILMSWVATLPIAAVSAGLVAWLLMH